MSNLISSGLVLMVALVITREQILEDIQAGTSREEVEAYFEQLTEEERIRFFTREDERQGTITHDLEEGESGYYVIGLRNVREHWWWPSFGSHLVVIVVISDESRVTDIEFFGSRSGWP